jgi:hypothetical protein
MAEQIIVKVTRGTISFDHSYEFEIVARRARMSYDHFKCGSKFATVEEAIAEAESFSVRLYDRTPDGWEFAHMAVREDHYLFGTYMHYYPQYFVSVMVARRITFGKWLWHYARTADWSTRKATTKSIRGW